MLATALSTLALIRLAQDSDLLNLPHPLEPQRVIPIHFKAQNASIDGDTARASRSYDARADGLFITQSCSIEVFLNSPNFLEGRSGRVDRGFFRGWRSSLAQRFAIAHELGHCLDETAQERAGLDYGPGLSGAEQDAWTRRKESFADAFATRWLRLEGASELSLKSIATERLANEMPESAAASSRALSAPIGCDDLKDPLKAAFIYAQRDLNPALPPAEPSCAPER